MFDLTKLTDAIGGLLSGNHQQALESTGLADLLANAGVDPALLDGLSQDEILSLLQEHGIDPSQLDPAQLTGLLQQSDLGANLAEAASSWLRSRNG